MHLHTIPNNSKMRVEFKDGWHDCLYHHPDGLYSFCTIEDFPEGSKKHNIFHLHVMANVEKVGDHYELMPPKLEDNADIIVPEGDSGRKEA